jgi:hypothetical protein
MVSFPQATGPVSKRQAVSHPYEIHLQAPSGQRRTLHLQAQSPSHAQLSAIELAGLGPRAKVLQCHRLGDW